MTCRPSDSSSRGGGWLHYSRRHSGSLPMCTPWCWTLLRGMQVSAPSATAMLHGHCTACTAGARSRLFVCTDGEWGHTRQACNTWSHHECLCIPDRLQGSRSALINLTAATKGRNKSTTVCCNSATAAFCRTAACGRDGVWCGHPSACPFGHKRLHLAG